MGVEVTNQQGEFLQMTEIARNFSNVIGVGVANDTELLTSLIEDLNIRGATAFIHLVQNVDEFEEAVAELATSQGASKKMADMQQTSLTNMTQKMRNAMKEVFFLSEAQFVANGHLNEFDMRLKSLVTKFTELFLTQMPDGTKQLTQFSYDIRELVIRALEGFSDLMETLVPQLIELTQGGFKLGEAVKAMFIPLKILNTTLVFTDRILGAVGGDGLLFKFGALSMMFGATAAAALMVADAIGAMSQKLGEINKIVGPLITLASIYYGAGGLQLAVKGVAAKGAGRALTKKPWTRFGRSYSDELDIHKSMKYPGGKPVPNMKYPKGHKALGEIREGLIDGPGGFNPKTGEILYKRGKAREIFGNQLPAYDANPASLAYLEDTLMFQSNYLRGVGLTQAQRGALGTYAFGRGSLNSWGVTGQNRAADPMMAQMGGSSNYGSSQDLYIANANIGNSNFQDLFYNSDQLGT